MLSMIQVIGKKNGKPVLRWQTLEEAMFILHINAIITDSEERKMRDRLKKACAKEGLVMRQVPGFPS